MSKWRVEFDGVWMPGDDKTSLALRLNGYSVGAFRDDKSGAYEYVLFREDNRRWVTVYSTHNQDELNNYINLLLPPEA